MIKFRENGSLKKRLEIFLNKALSKPISLNQPKDELFDTLFLEKNEFSVISYSIINSILIITSRRLIIKGVNNFEIHFSDIIGISLERNFKNEQTPRWLNIFTRTKMCYTLTFNDLATLIEARNVVYRVINTTIENWEGASFKMNEEVSYSKFERIIP